MSPVISRLAQRSLRLDTPSSLQRVRGAQMYDALGDVCALAQDVRVGLLWRDAWDMGAPLLVAAWGAGVATVSDRTAA